MTLIDGRPTDAERSDGRNVPPDREDALLPPPQRRRRWGLLATIAVALAVLLAVGGGTGLLYWRFRQIPRADSGCLDQGGVQCPGSLNSSDPLPTIAIPLNGSRAVTRTVTPDGGSGSSQPSKSSGSTKPSGTSGTSGSKATDATIRATGPLIDISAVKRLGGPNTKNILMLGLDSRANIPADQQQTFGDAGGSRTDTIMVLRIDRDTNRAWVLSFPRDLWVRTAGTDTFNRINAAYVKGLPTLVSTIRENFRIPIWHVVLVDFVGFEKVVSAVDGVTICFPKASRDVMSGLNQPAGCNQLGPEQAIAYVRSRHLQVGENGKWTEDPTGDFGRIARQQTFIRAALSKALDKGLRNPVMLNSLLASLKDALQIDSSFNFSDVTGLANDFRSFDPNQLQSFTVPATNRRISGKAVLVLDTKAATKIVGQFGG